MNPRLAHIVNLNLRNGLRLATISCRTGQVTSVSVHAFRPSLYQRTHWHAVYWGTKKGLLMKHLMEDLRSTTSIWMQGNVSFEGDTGKTANSRQSTKRECGQRVISSLTTRCFLISKTSIERIDILNIVRTAYLSTFQDPEHVSIKVVLCKSQTNSKRTERDKWTFWGNNSCFNEHHRRTLHSVTSSAWKDEAEGD